MLGHAALTSCQASKLKAVCRDRQVVDPTRALIRPAGAALCQLTTIFRMAPLFTAIIDNHCKINEFFIDVTGFEYMQHAAAS